MKTKNTKKEDMREAFEERGYDIDRSSCSECSETKTCKYAWDLYNTNGDCLADK